MPSSWATTKVNELFIINPKNKIDDNVLAGFVPMANVSDGFSNFFTYEKRKWVEIKKGYAHFQDGDIAVAKISPCLENRKSVIFSDLPNGIGSGTTELNIFRTKGAVLPEYALCYFKSKMFIDGCAGTYNGVVGQQRVAKNYIAEKDFFVPPLNEQKRIISKVKDLFSFINELDTSEKELNNSILSAKSKILDLAIRGRLVPQDPNDEPASELLKRLGITSDNRPYENLPNRWSVCTLEDITEYEQPQNYIVSSTNYANSYNIPVLTAGKSFIIGYTNDKDGIFTNLPVIIFDDFTTESKYVDFPFKVKSSAMKILKVKKGIDIKYVTYFMSITRLVGQTHKRYWISEYCKLPIPIPPLTEQKRIVAKIEELFSQLDIIASTLK